MVYKQVLQWEEFNAQHTGALVDVWKNGIYVDSLTPSKVNFKTSTEVVTDVDIYRTLLEDLYLSLSSFNQDSSITLSVYLNRLVLLIPLSLVFFVVGALVGIRA